MTRRVRWTASNTTSGTVLAVRTAWGWMREDGLVLLDPQEDGCQFFGRPARPVSERVLARVRRELRAAGGAS